MGIRKEKRIRITSFQMIRRGDWYLKFSVTSEDTIMLLFCNEGEKENWRIQFFKDEMDAIAFIDLLISQPDKFVDGT